MLSMLCAELILFIAGVFCHLATANHDNVTDIFCFACGFQEIDPELDLPGSFGDGRLQWTPQGKKMYNYTCDIANQMGLDYKWMRKCPHGVKSCFWSKTSHDNQVAFFRGCAPSFFPMTPGCRTELESVQVNDKSSVRVAPRVELCFCNHDNCNFANSIEAYSVGNSIDIFQWSIILSALFWSQI